jgi:NAD(P)-dependent dehydrogenase (short-subunit alcohol dehydrogenase family)
LAARDASTELEGDLTDPQFRARLLAVHSRGADYLVVCHGIAKMSRIADVAESEWDEIFDANAKSVFFLVRDFCELAAPGSSVVLVSSAAAKMGSNVEGAVYAASKAAVIMMTRSFAHAYADRGVRVNCVCPGLIDTPLYASVLEQLRQARQVSLDTIVSARARAVPLSRVGQPAEVASAIWFLLTGATYVTGEALNVGGGLVMD